MTNIPGPQRVLGRIRLSRASDESTSAERQRELIERWAADNGHTVIGWAEDLDISGSVDPFDTPALGAWLKPDKLAEWDVLCAWKLDRLARRAVPLHRLFGMCEEHGKTLVCVSDNIDLSHWVGRLVASVIAGVAEGELEAIRERTKASHRKLREMGRWPGGKPAYGYRAREREDAAGWELVPDEHSAAVLREIIGQVLDGQTVESIAKALTERGEPSPADYIRQRSGEATRGGVWRGQTIRNLLRSKTLLGHVTHNGVTVRDSEGAPVSKGPALITGQEFDRLQTVLESKSFTVTRSTNASPLLGVAVCAVCEHPLHHRGQTTAGKLYRYYYCRNCKGPQAHAEEVELLLEQTFLEQEGDKPVRERIYVPADDQREALREAVEAVDELTELLRSVSSDTVKERLRSQLRALDSRIGELENTPAKEAGWEYRETGQTYRQAWDAADTDGRRQLLLRSRITAAVRLKKRHEPSDSDTPDFHLRVPD